MVAAEGGYELIEYGMIAKVKPEMLRP